MEKCSGWGNFSLVGLHDWSKAGHPFDPVKEDFMTFVFEGRKQDQNELPVEEHGKTDERKRHTTGKISMPPA